MNKITQFISLALTGFIMLCAAYWAGRCDEQVMRGDPMDNCGKLSCHDLAVAIGQAGKEYKQAKKAAQYAAIPAKVWGDK